MALKMNNNIRLIGFDLDGTLVSGTEFIWSTLHEYFGCDPIKRRQAAQDYHAGKISYAQWFENDLDMLKEQGATQKEIQKAFGRLRLSPGAKETLEALKSRGYRLGLISGSLDILLDHFLPDKPFDHVLINRVHFDANGIITGGTPTPYDLEGKADGLKELARRAKVGLFECAFVGDNYNDIAVMRLAAFSVGVFLKSPLVANVATVVIRDQDLRSILSWFPGPKTKAD